MFHKYSKRILSINALIILVMEIPCQHVDKNIPLANDLTSLIDATSLSWHKHAFSTYAAWENLLVKTSKTYILTRVGYG